MIVKSDFKNPFALGNGIEMLNFCTLKELHQEKLDYIKKNCMPNNVRTIIRPSCTKAQCNNQALNRRDE